LENKLRRLYALQQIDTKLDELEEEKGDLPSEIKELEWKDDQLKSQLMALEQAMKDAFMKRDEADSEIISLKGKVEKYKAQQFQVKNNKQYDALTKEMDFAAETIAKLEKEMELLEGKAVLAKNDIETLKTQVDELDRVLGEKRSALAEVSRSTAAEEQKYSHERQKLVTRITKSDLASYERIRKAKKGKAIVVVKRNACGGCFNRVPPQKLLELRQNDKIYTCEHCGRIIVSDEIAETSSSIV
jgi:predicted  nucleic acid-binding Zn-ribbon protein